MQYTLFRGTNLTVGSFLATIFMLILAPPVFASRLSVEAMPATSTAEQHSTLLIFPNHGQLDSPALFYNRSANHAAFFLNERVRIGFQPTLKGERPQGRTENPDRIDFFDISFVGARSDLAPEGSNLQLTRMNFFPGSDASSRRTNLPTFREVRYPSVWPGIDINFGITAGSVKYEMQIEAGRDLSQIKLLYAGVKAAALDEEGNLLLQTNRGSRLQEARPVSFQEVDSVRQSVDIQYQIISEFDSTLGGAVIGFSAREFYSSEIPLTIDPDILFSTYLGGATSSVSTQSESFRYLDVDSQGNTVAVARVATLDYPTTDGSQNPNEAIVVSKLSADLSELIFSTVFCSDQCGTPQGVVLDAQDRIYLTGTAERSNFPTTSSAFQSSFRGASNAFVVQLNASGDETLYSSLLGGDGVPGVHAGNDVAEGIAVDAQGHIYIVGSMASPTFPTTPTAFDRTFHAGDDGRDGFAAKFDPTKSGAESLVYSTILGGTCNGCTIWDSSQENRLIQSERARDVAVDGEGNAYVVGVATSSDFPVTTQAIDTTINGRQDAFVAKIDPLGENLIYSTFLGGGAREIGNTIEVDEAGHAYVAGSTNSGNFPTTPGALDRDFEDQVFRPVDAFVAKINPSGSGLVYSTYLGRANNEFVNDVDIDASGNAYIVGWLNRGVDYPVTDDAIPLPSGGFSTLAFLSKISPEGSELLFSTLLAGNGQNYANTVRAEDNGDVWILGETTADNFPTTPFAYSRTREGDRDAFIMKVSTVEPVTLTIDSVQPNEGGNTGQVTLSIRGGGFLDVSRVFLAGSVDIEAESVVADGSEYLETTFDLAEAPLGEYSVVIENTEGEQAILDSRFEISTTTSGISGRVVGRSSLGVRRGSGSSDDFEHRERIFVAVENSSNVDAFVPFSITIPGQESLAGVGLLSDVRETITIGDEEFSFPVVLEATADQLSKSAGGYAADGLVVLRPGEKRAIPVEFTYSCGEAETEVRVEVRKSAADLTTFERCMTDVAFFLGSFATPGLQDCILSTFQLTATIVDTFEDDSLSSAGVFWSQYIVRILGCADIVAPGIGTVLSTSANGLATLYSCAPVIEDLLFSQSYECGVSSDPNTKFGPAGIGLERYIQGGTSLNFAVHFENLQDATAPAQDVVVTDLLDPATMKLATLQPELFSIGERIVAPRRSDPLGDVEFDLRPDLDLLVRVDTTIDDEAGTAVFRFTSVDPDTGEPLDDSSLEGFLPPNQTSPEGQGFILFSIDMAEDLPTGTVIANQADIVFDANEPIETPVWTNTVDATTPTSQVLSLAPIQCGASFEVFWSGGDEGSGVADFTISVSEDGGPFEVWLERTPDTSGVFAGEVGKSYAFRAEARDRVGLIEEKPPIPEATTTVIEDSLPPATAASLVASPNEQGWHNSSVTVNLIAVDEPSECGVAEISWELTQLGEVVDSATIPGGEGSVSVANEGHSELTFIARDAAGNIEEAQSIALRVDSTPPTIRGLPETGTVLWPPDGSFVTVATVSAEDLGSGLAPGSLQLEVSSSESIQPGDIEITEGTIKLRAIRDFQEVERTYTIIATAWDQAGNQSFEEREILVPAGDCYEEQFEEGSLIDWTLASTGHANQLDVEIVDDEGNMELALTAAGATAYLMADNVGFFYKELSGDFRVETSIDSSTMITGKPWRKAGLMVRASLDTWDIRLLNFLAPIQERLQFVARDVFGGPGNIQVANEVDNAPDALRLAIERNDLELRVQYSLDQGATWITPDTGPGGSIEVPDLPETLLVGLAVVSNNITTTSTALFDDVSFCISNW